MPKDKQNEGHCNMTKISIKNIIETTMDQFKLIKADINRMNNELRGLESLLQNRTYHEEIDHTISDYSLQDRTKTEKLVKKIEKKQSLEKLTSEDF